MSRQALVDIGIQCVCGHVRNGLPLSGDKLNLNCLVMLRKRSGDTVSNALTGGMPEATSKNIRRKPSPTAFALVTALSTFLITLVVLARFRQHESSQVDAFPAVQVDANVGGDDIFSLHPQVHSLRGPKTIQQRWRITSGTRRPDGVLKRVYLINDDFPGPTIEARSGDRLVINIENALEDDEGVSFHWHGLSMRAANAMDGAAGVTQTHIKPSETFTYDFEIEPSQHGTFWYHAHDGVQRADGLFGGLVVHEPFKDGSRPPANDEGLLLVGDWYHRSAIEALDFYMHPGSFGNEPIPDSILLNGQGIFNCDDAVPARPLDCEQRHVEDVPTLKLNGGRPSILRVVNVGVYTGVELTATGATLTSVSVDGGHKVEEVEAQTFGPIYPGERVDFLVKSMPGASTHANLEVALDTTAFRLSNSALTTTRRYPLRWTLSPDVTEKVMDENNRHFELQMLKSKELQSALLPEAADHTIVLYAITQKLSHLKNVPHGFINNTYHKSQAEPLITLPREDWDKNQFVPHMPYDSATPIWVDIVLNNLDEEGHPFHLHGYDFWVLSTYSSELNWGSYNPFGPQDPPGGPYDLVKALRKDTVYVPRRGYAVLRLRADNPGLWMFHCHVLWHQASGMAMTFDVSE